MKRLLGILAIILILNTMIIPISAKTIDSDDSLFDKKIEFYMKIAHMPSFSACIIKNDTLLWCKSYGYADLKTKKLANLSTVYMIGSISKMFIAFAIMQLYEQGMFGLDDNINDYLPFKIYNPNYPDVNITFRMLLAHQSSLYDLQIQLFFYFSVLGYPKEWISEFLTPGGFIYNPKAWCDFPPGAEHYYSNIGYILLGVLLEELTNQSVEEYCTKNIFEPLDMKNTSYHLKDFDIKRIAIPYVWFGGKYITLPIYDLNNMEVASVKTTVSDLSHFLGVHNNNGVYNGKRFLKEETIKLMQKAQYPNGTDGFAWKYRTLSDGRTYATHSGAVLGYRSRVMIYQPEHIGVVYSYNQYQKIPTREKYNPIGRMEKYAREKIELMLFEKGEKLADT